MPNLNQVNLMGNLTRDPELKFTQKGTAVCEIGMAINRTYKTEAGEKREETTFVDVSLWGRVAEIVNEYCKKGNPLFVSGRLQLDQWDDKQTGQKRSKLKVIGENIQLLGSKPSTSAESHDDRDHERKPPAQQKPPPKDPDLDPKDDDPWLD